MTNRLTTHSKDSDKDYWDSKTLVVVAKDNSLNSTDCLYLESRLIDLATKSAAADVRNQTNPLPPFLAATDKTRVENFLMQIQTLLPVLNINFFTPPIVLQLPSVNATSTVASSQFTTPTNGDNVATFVSPGIVPSTTFVLSVKGLHAEAEYVNNLFIVRLGSQASSTEGALANTYKELRHQYITTGVLHNDPITGKLVFNQDVPFTSTSAAAAVVCGYSMNGPKNWKVKGTGQTFDAWRQAQLP